MGRITNLQNHIGHLQTLQAQRKSRITLLTEQLATAKRERDEARAERDELRAELKALQADDAA